MMVWSVAVTFFMFGVFILGFFFGISFGIWVADKIKDDLAKHCGKREG